MTVASRRTAIAMPTPMLLIVMMSARAKAAKTDDHDQGRPGDHAGRPGQALGHRRGVVAGPPVGLLDPRQEEDLVVHRQPEDHAEHDDRVAGDGVADRREVEDVAEVALLEDPDERPEAGADREQGHDHGLDRDRDRPEEQEEDERAGEEGEPRPRSGIRSRLRLEEVVAGRGLRRRPGSVIPAPAGSARTDGVSAGRRRLRRVERADRVEPDGVAADVGLLEGADRGARPRAAAGRRAGRRAAATWSGVSARPGRRVGEGVGALDVVDPLDRAQRVGVAGQGQGVGRVGRVALDRGEDDDRGRLAAAGTRSRSPRTRRGSRGRPGRSPRRGRPGRGGRTASRG